MSINAGLPARLHLPGRIRSKRSAADGSVYSLALAKRLGGQPRIAVGVASDGSMPQTFRIHLASPSRESISGDAGTLICQLSRDGFTVYGLSDADRHQVLRTGWGRLQHDHVVLHVPRDEEELDICWLIIEQAFQALAVTPADFRGMRSTAPWDLPRFSRTPLQ
ncbi:MAG: hypothetical protein GTO71_04275 [Woeseiaceae bacterium]|nr:hypothetical protein [Woeseiaceae bacterium]NIP20316.1 hypothetical protein [Woeseiaceae bacterium]